MSIFIKQCIFSILFVFISIFVQASFKNDTILAGKDYRIGQTLADSAKLDSALSFFRKAEAIYLRQKIWDKYLNCRGSIFLCRRGKNDNYNIQSYILESLRLSLAKFGNGNVITGNCYLYLGNFFADKENVDTAEYYFRKALSNYCYDKVHNCKSIAKMYLNIGIMLMDQNKFDSALIYFDKSLELHLTIFGQNNLNTSQVFNGKGCLYYYMGDYNNCLENFSKVIDIRKLVLGYNHPEVARGYNNMGAVYEKLGKYKEALDVDNKALAIRLAVLNPNNRDISLSYNNIGNIYINTGQYATALKYHLKALEARLLNVAQLPGDVIMSYSNIAICDMFMGIYDDALVSLRKVASYDFEKFGENNIKTADAFNNIGDVYEEMGESDSALYYYNHALTIRLRLLAKNHPSITGSYDNIGCIYNSKGDYETALRYFLKGLAISNEIFGKENPGKASSYLNIGTVYYQMCNYEKALEYLNESFALNKNTLNENNPDVGKTLKTIASIYKCQKKFNDAITYSLQAENILKQTYGNKHREIASLYSDIALLYNEMHNIPLAMEYQQKAIEIYKSIYNGKYYELADAYNNAGDIQLNAGNYNQAICYYQSGLCANDPDFTSMDIRQNPDITKALSNYEMLLSLKKKSIALYKIYQKEGNPEKLKLALSTLDLAFQLINEVRISYKLTNSKFHFVEEATDIYSLGIDIAYKLFLKTKDQIYLSKLYSISQQSKSRVLFDAVEQSKNMHFAGIPDSIIMQEKEVKALLDGAELKLQRTKYEEKFDSLSLTKLEDKVFQFTVQYKQLSDSIDLKYPLYKELVKNSLIPTLGEVQANLDSSTCLLDYMVGDSDIYIFVASKQIVTVKQVKIDSSFYKSIDIMLSGIRKNREEQVIINSCLLYKKLITPIEKELTGVRRIVIIPDKQLLYLPFEALTKPSLKANNKNKPDYLIYHYDVTYNYSIALAYLNIGNRNQNISVKYSQMKDFAGFAPVFDDTVNQTPIFTIKDSLSKHFAALRSVIVNNKKYTPLHNSKQEIINIVSLFTKHGLAGIGYLNEQATESKFKDEISKYRIIHLATHGITNDEFPELSGFVFSPDKIDSAGTKSDNLQGILFAGDIYHLKLNADLVVLSACESGTGKLVRGEGLMSLTRGFVYAGVPQIIYSLWKVDDKSTSVLMTKFYDLLLQKIPVDKALREAKLMLINNPATSSPRFWAAFALLGK